MERIVITFTDAGEFRGASVADFNGQPKPLDETALNALFPAVNASSLSLVTTLQEDLSEMTTAKESATTELDTATSRVESLESQLADTQTQLATAQGEASNVPNLQSQLESATARVESLESQLATAQGEASNVPNLQSQLDTALARIAELEAVPAVGGVTKLTIMRRLGEKWPTLKVALLTLPEIVQDAWLLAQEIRADDELILTYGETLKGLLDLTDEEFTDLLTP